MAEDIKELENLIVLHKKHQSYLRGIRHWEELEVAIEEDRIWLKGFSDDKFNHPSLLKIPFIKRYLLREEYLYPRGKTLPIHKVKSEQNWMPIQKAFPIEFPKLNHNYFETKIEIEFKLIPSKDNTEGSAMLTNLKTLKNQLEEIANFRMQNLKWTIIDEEYAFMIGKPLLPLQGQSFWNFEGTYLPTGKHFVFPKLHPSFLDKLDLNSGDFVLWIDETNYKILNREHLSSMTRSSVRKSLKV